MTAIYKKEMRSFFTSMIGYLFIGFFLLFAGLYHFYSNLLSGYTNVGYALSGVTIFFVLLVPMITMRSLAEERKQKTDQLLLTSPVSIGKIVLGKFFALATMVLIVCAFICLYPVVLAEFGTVNYAENYTAIGGFFLLGCTFMAVGMFISALTESQAMAAIITFTVVLFSLFGSAIANIIPTDNFSAWIVFAVIALIFSVIAYAVMKNILVSVAIFFVAEVALALVYLLVPEVLDGSVIAVFKWISVVDRFDSFAYGTPQLSGIVYYISMTALFVFLTVQAVKKRRWN